MGDKSAIEWTDASWTPIRARNIKTGKIGWHCEHATAGCEFCYAEGMNKRLGTGLPFKPGHRKDIDIFLDEEMLLAPLRWKKPRKIFVCSMTDVFAGFVKDEWLDNMFAVMALCPQHTFQVLTKRAGRMQKYCSWKNGESNRYRAQHSIWMKMPRLDVAATGCKVPPWPLPNVWLGVSCERQEEADERTPLLLQTPAAVRFISAEPLLGPIDLTKVRHQLAGKSFEISSVLHGDDGFGPNAPRNCLDWVIVGGESGPNARPMHPQWAREIFHQCETARVPFFFKQWGEWAPGDFASETAEDLELRNRYAVIDYNYIEQFERVGKKAAGRILDGRTNDEFPTGAA